MAHSRTYATSYCHLAVYVPITLHKARYGPTALTLWYHYISTSRLCYNGTLVWLSLTNTPHACHFSVAYNVRIAGVFIHSSICLSHFPIINCTHSFVAHCQYIAYHIHKVNPVMYHIFLHAIFINMPVCMSSLTYLLPLNYAPCRSHHGLVSWCCESHSVVSSKRSEPPRTTHAWLFQCKSMHRETGERQWTTEIASSLVAVAVHRCTEERKSTGSW